MTGEGDFSKVSASASAAATTDLLCCRDCARELILLLRLRGVIGLLEADGIFSRTSLGSLKEIERERGKSDVIPLAQSQNRAHHVVP